MRAVIGIILSAAGGIAAATGIVGLVDLGSCAGACPAHTALLPYLIGGIVAVTASAFFWRWAMVLAPVVGLAAAGVQLAAAGTDLLGDDLGFTAFIAACVLAGPIIVVLVGLYSAGRRARARAIAETGQRAIAEVQDIRGTGVQINNQPQVSITFQITPLDGTPPFTYTSRRTIGFGDLVPRVGLRWPAWYTGPRSVAIGAPNANPNDAESRALLAAFGIAPVQAYGYDPSGGQGGVAAGPALGTTGAAYQGFGP